MRPLRLQLEGFTAFRRRQELLLGPHDLFAISGPTGAGKSSLLDALVFALYGKVPRGLAPRELIALGRSEGWVLLEFTVAARQFRVTRKVVRGAKGGVQNHAQLEELETGGERSLANGVTAVNAEIQRLVGLNFETFTQAVILPQGEFARFLKAEPRVRQAILRDLLRLSVYERMRKRAEDSARALKSDIEQRERLLADEYAGATPEAVASERDAAAAAQTAAAAGAETAREIEAALVGDLGLRSRHAHTRELAERRARAGELERAAAAWADDERRLEAARRAGAVLPRLEALETAERRVMCTASECQAAESRAGAAAQGLATAQTRAERSEHEAAELPALEARLAALAQALALAAPLLAARQHFEQTQADVRRRESVLENARASAIAATRTVEQSRAAAAQARQAHGSIEYDAGTHQRLEAAREQLGALEARRNAQAAATEGAQAAQQALARLEIEEVQATERADVADRELQAAGHARAQAEQALREAEREHAAAHLRATLQKGDPCPVCDRKIERLPKAANRPLLDLMANPVDRRRDTEERARKAHGVAREALARAQASATQARATLAERRHEATGLATELASLEARLRAALGDGDERRLRERLTTLAVARGARDAAQSAAERAEALSEHAALRVAQAQGDAEAAERELSAARERLTAAGAAQQALLAQHAELGAGDDATAEQRRLANQRVSLRDAAVRAAQALASAREAEAAARAASAAAVEARQSAATDAQATQARAERALAEAGFRTAADARGAALDEAAQQALRQSLTAGRDESAAVARRLIELERVLAGSGGAVPDDVLQEHERRLVEARTRAEQALREASARGGRLAELARRAAQAGRLADELRDLRVRQQTLRGLADDLRSDQFQAWLLEETFRDLVAGASQRLQELSGRYTFEYANDEFHVLDHDHAGERRRADSLSGGETFVASLALALELSQHLQRLAGAVRLDSLFIDEGFGTLDPETLDTIAGAIENLGVAGRMVGIVTHVPELTARLPVRFMVRKRPEGSDVVLEGA